MDDQTTKQVKILTDAGALKSAVFIAALSHLSRFRWGRISAAVASVPLSSAAVAIVRARLGL